MSHPSEPSSAVPESELEASQTPGFRLGEKKTLEQYAELDKDDESLAKWKASLGIGNAPSNAGGTGARVTIHSLSLQSESRKEGPIVFDLSGGKDKLVELKKKQVVIKEGAEYAVELKFSVNSDVVSGLRYIQVVKRAGLTVDKMETMIGSYGPSAEPIVKRFVTEEAPNGMLARSGSYNVRSRIIDDDKNVHVDFEWTFKIGKDW